MESKEGESGLVYSHNPVLLEETIALLKPCDGKTYLDGTFGGGGHTRAILQSANCNVVAIDKDPQAIERAKAFKDEFGDRFTFVSSEFSKLDKLQNAGYAGILFDFGVSSFQLDQAHRGFSFTKDGPLDMRMDNNNGLSALDYIKNTNLHELAKVLREYGEEKRFMKIAKIIINARDTQDLTSTKQLADIIAKEAPNIEKIHPATKAFQALRILVNDELGQIRQALPLSFNALEKGGILAAISFHSLEDRIVKQFFKKMAGRPESRWDKSYLADRLKQAQILTNKPIIATQAEIQNNARSRSAKLRAIKKD